MYLFLLHILVRLVNEMVIRKDPVQSSGRYPQPTVSLYAEMAANAAVASSVYQPEGFL